MKLRKEGSVSRSDYNDVRDQVDSVRSEARGDGGVDADSGSVRRHRAAGMRTRAAATDRVRLGHRAASGSGGVYGGTTDSADAEPATRRSRRNEVPAGQEIDVRLERELSSDTAQVEDRFTATTVVDLYQGNDVLIPAGSTLRGVVSSVNKATRTDRKGSLTVAFDQVTIRGRSYPIRATVTQALESEGIKGEAARSARARASARSSAASSAAPRARCSAS